MYKIKHNGVQYLCESYPCHKDLQDCTFCYCPYYPCRQKSRGGKMLDAGVWDCTGCTWIHQIDTVEKIYNKIAGVIDD